MGCILCGQGGCPSKCLIFWAETLLWSQKRSDILSFIFRWKLFDGFWIILYHWAEPTSNQCVGFTNIADQSHNQGSSSNRNPSSKIREEWWVHCFLWNQWKISNFDLLDCWLHTGSFLLLRIPSCRNSSFVQLCQELERPFS